MIGIVGILIVVAGIAWRSRENALLLLVASLPLYLVRFSVGPIPFTLLECMVGVIFFVWIVRERRLTAAVKECVKERRVFCTFTLLFLVSATISVFVSPDTRAALGVWRAYFIEPILVFFMAYDMLRTKDQLRHMLDACIVSGVFIASIAVYQRFTGWHIPDPWLSEMRVTSIFPYPNAVGLYLAPMMPLIILRFFDSLKIRTHVIRLIGYSIAFFIFFAAIYFAKTEGALVALAVGIPFMGFIWSARTRMITGGICVLIVGAIALSPNFFTPIKEKVLLQDWSGHVRQTIWKETYAMLVDRGVLGAGLAGYQKTIESYHKATYIEIFLYPHTIFLNFWSEVGLLGLGAYAGIVGTFFFTLAKAFRRAREDITVKMMCLGLCGSLLVIMIHGLVDVPYFKNDLAVFFWLLMALSLAVVRVSQQKSTYDPTE